MGRSFIVEVEGTLDTDVSLRQAEDIGHQVKHAVLDRVENVRHVQWMAHCPASSDAHAA